MHRFFVPINLLTTTHAVLPPDTARQVTRVLRLRAGQRIILFGGDGLEVEATLGDTGGKEVVVTLGERTSPDVDLRCKLHMALSVLKGEKMDWTIQKLTELGATSIHLMLTERTISSAGEERWSRRLERYRRIAQEAAEQCGGVRIPEVMEPQGLPSLAADSTLAETRVILDPLSDRPLGGLLPVGSLLIMVGPEGGFSSNEVALAAENGLERARLGRRVLRAETAAVTAAALVAMSDTAV